MMFLQVIILLAGFLFLVKGADWFVEGAASIAKKLGNSTVDHWINHCSNGNQHAGGSSQYYCCNK
mgnify:FL=1